MKKFAIILATIFVYCHCQTVVPLDPLITLPASSNSEPLPSHVFFCGIVENRTDYTSSWTTPTGTTIQNTEIGTIVSAESGKYTVQNGRIGTGGFIQGSIFSVMRLIYSDAGEYICSITFTESGTTETVTFMLALNVFLRRFGETRIMEAGEDVSLPCEMSGYIRSDSDFTWMKGNVTVMDNDRKGIIVNDGALMRGQNGGTSSVPSRVSTLIITNLMESDGGVYTCLVVGTGVEANIELTVIGSTEQSYTTPSTLPASTANSTTVDFSTLEPITTTIEGQSPTLDPTLVIGITTGIVSLIIIVTTILLTLFVSKKKIAAAKLKYQEPLSRREVVELTAGSSQLENENGGVGHEQVEEHLYEEVDKDEGIFNVHNSNSQDSHNDNFIIKDNEAYSNHEDTDRARRRNNTIDNIAIKENEAYGTNGILDEESEQGETCNAAAANVLYENNIILVD